MTKPVGFWLEVAERRFASVKFPYEMETWGWATGLSSDLEAAAAQAVANQEKALKRAEHASKMRWDEIEAAAYRSHHWFEAMIGWQREAEFWASVAADADAVSLREAA